MSCLDCVNELVHCHDYLVLHLDGSTECLNPGCDGNRGAHEWLTSCMELQWPCDCQRVGHTHALAA